MGSLELFQRSTPFVSVDVENLVRVGSRLSSWSQRGHGHMQLYIPLPL